MVGKKTITGKYLTARVEGHPGQEVIILPACCDDKRCFIFRLGHLPRDLTNQDVPGALVKTKKIGVVGKFFIFNRWDDIVGNIFSKKTFT